MKPSELLREVRRIVLVPGRWVSYDAWLGLGWHGGGACGCVLNHLSRLASINDCAAAMEEALNQMGGFALVIWTNDRGPTRLWGVVKLLSAGIRSLEARGR